MANHNSKRSVRCLTGWWPSVLCAGLVLLALPAGVDLAAAKGLRIGVIDRQAILERTKAGQAAIQELKEFSATRHGLVANDEQELRELERAIQDQASGLSEEARRQKQEGFRARVEQYQRRVQEFNREIQQKELELGEAFQKKLREVAEAVATRRDFAVIMEKGSPVTIQVVIYHASSIDLTDEVIKEMDRRHR
ncbi:MAG: OmpH family outer membrane protein [Nitrospirales bacterium]